MSSTNPPPPAERASEIINGLPSSPGIITKTGAALLGTGLLATAISQEIYVVNEETVVAVGTFILFAYIYRVCALVPCQDLPPNVFVGLVGNPRTVQELGKWSHRTYQGCSQRCACWTHTSCQRPHQLCRANEGRRFTHGGSLWSLKGQLVLSCDRWSPI